MRTILLDHEGLHTGEKLYLLSMLKKIFLEGKVGVVLHHTVVKTLNQ